MMPYYLLMRSSDGTAGDELLGVYTSAERAREEIEASYADEGVENFVLLRFAAERIEVPEVQS